METTINNNFEKHMKLKVMKRLMPILVISLFIAIIDRINISFASLQMNEDLHFSAAAFGLGAGLFFIGYFLFEVPSNLLLKRIGPRIWIARIMFTWGLVVVLMAFWSGQKRAFIH